MFFMRLVASHPRKISFVQGREGGRGRGGGKEGEGEGEGKGERGRGRVSVRERVGKLA